MTYFPGEIYNVNLGPSGEHRFVVLSREELNRGNQIITAMITSASYAVRSKLPNCVSLQAGEFGMTQDCVIQCENVVALSTDELRGKLIDELDATTMREVIKALGHVFDAECEPN